MPADILLYALIAAGLVFWLKTILGTRDEDDLPPKKPSLFSDEEEGIMKRKGQKGDNNVVSLDALVGVAPIARLPRHVRIDNKTTENKLEDISHRYESFDLVHFTQGAEQAFQMIIEAFAEGDLDTLKNLLADDVYQAFEKVILERKEKGESVSTEIQSIEKIDIIKADLEDDCLKLTVRFTAREICVIRDKDDNIISGDPERVTEMVDVWVFGRDLNSDAPEWYLYETRDDEIEDHKTPIPESSKD